MALADSSGDIHRRRLTRATGSNVEAKHLCIYSMARARDWVKGERGSRSSGGQQTNSSEQGKEGICI